MPSSGALSDKFVALSVGCSFTTTSTPIAVLVQDGFVSIESTGVVKYEEETADDRVFVTVTSAI